MTLECPPIETLPIKVYCLCSKFASFGCATPALKVAAKLLVADSCDPPVLSDGAIVLPFTSTFYPGQCIKLPATSGSNPDEHINGSGYYEITVWDLETNSVLFGPVHVDISSDLDPEDCIDLTTLLEAC